MSRSLADWDLSLLSREARETFDEIAFPISEGSKPDELAEKLRITTGELNARLEHLSAELDAQTGGAVVRPLTPDEYEALRESIREHGQLVPALVDDQGKIISGHNRKRACDELGLELQTVTWQGPAELAHHIALADNFVRRQLRASDRRRAVLAELQSHPERSDRAIATAIGVAPGTVGKARQQLEQDGRLSKLDSRISADGRTRPAGQPPRDDTGTPTRFDAITDELRSLAALEDREHAHARADELLLQALRLAGLDDIAAAWEQSGPRYYRL